MSNPPHALAEPCKHISELLSLSHTVHSLRRSPLGTSFNEKTVLPVMENKCKIMPLTFILVS